MTTEPKKKSNFLCLDCNINTSKINEYYMVHNSIWKEAGGKLGMLCIGCLEKRIGRQLKPEDFTNYPINDITLFSKSPRLLNRLTGK